jgi:hypothetical protein
VQVVEIRAWVDADITELLNFKYKAILAVDWNTKHAFWNSTSSNPLWKNLFVFFDKNDSEISAPHCPTHYSPEGNCDVLDIVVRQISLFLISWTQTI